MDPKPIYKKITDPTLRVGEVFQGTKGGLWVYRGRSEDGGYVADPFNPKLPATPPPPDEGEKTWGQSARDKVAGWLRPEKPDESPTLSALAELTGDVVGGVADTPRVAGEAGKAIVKGAIERPTTTAAGIALAATGAGLPVAIPILMGASMVDDYGRGLMERRLPDPVEVTTNAVATGATELIAPSSGGARPTVRQMVDDVVDVIRPEAKYKPTVGMLPGPGGIDTNAVRQELLEQQIQEEQTRVASLAKEGAEKFGLKNRVPGSVQGSELGQLGDTLALSTPGRQGATRARLEVAAKEAEGAGRRYIGVDDMEQPHVTARPVVAGVQAQREGLDTAARGIAEAGDETVRGAEIAREDAIAEAVARAGDARRDLDTTVRMIKESAPSGVEAAEQMREAVTQKVAQVREWQKAAREYASNYFQNPDFNERRRAAEGTREVLVKLAADNNLFKGGALISPNQTSTFVDSGTARWLHNTLSERDVTSMTPRELEALRQEVGSMIGQAQEAAARGDSRAGYAAGVLGQVYAQLKDVQMSMYDAQGRAWVRRADDIFKENLPVMQELEPFLNRTPTQRVPDLMFSPSNRAVQVRAAEVAPDQYGALRDAKLADLVPTSGDPDVLQQRVKMLGEETARDFDTKPVAARLQAELDRLAAAEAAIPQTRKATASSVQQAREVRSAMNEQARAWQTAFRERYGELPTAQEVHRVFSSEPEKIEQLRRSAELAGTPDAFDKLRAAWLWEQYSSAGTLKEFERRLNKLGSETRALYFDSPEAVELVNNFRLMSALKERATQTPESRGSIAWLNNALVTPIGWMFSKALQKAGDAEARGDLGARGVSGAIRGARAVAGAVSDAPLLLPAARTVPASLETDEELEPGLAGALLGMKRRKAPEPNRSEAEPRGLERAFR